MPTHEEPDRFRRDYDALTPAEKRAFKIAVRKFVAGLRAGAFPPGLRIKAVQGLPGCFELTWAGNGRAIWTYGPERVAGQPHIIWIAIGGHDILP